MRISGYSDGTRLAMPHGRYGLNERKERQMRTNRTFSAILFQEGESWGLRCLEVNVGAYGSTVEEAEWRFLATMEAERQYTLERHGEEFAGLPPAPDGFQSMWANGHDANRIGDSAVLKRVA